MFNGKNILITGGTGSFGKKFIQITLNQFKPKKLLIYSRDELKQFEMSQRWNTHEYPCLQYFLGDVRDKERLAYACRGIDYVVHAAALKQVPAAELNPTEFIRTNVEGAMNVIDAAIRNNVQKVVALSTDKACNPVNLYGATKLCSDKLFTAASSHGGEGTRFSVVRYGNVLGSRGSVIPFFKERAKAGVLPITDPEMTRFWITLDQAVHFVHMAMSRTEGGELFVPKIPTMKIVDLARAIGPQCKQEVVGIRQGEKIHETLIGEDDARNTVEFKEYYVIQQNLAACDKLISMNNGTGKVCDRGFRYASDCNKDVLSVEQLARLIDQISDDYSIEKSRWSMKGVPE